MIRIESSDQAIILFEQAAIRHTKASETGDSKAANRSYVDLINAKEYLRRNHRSELLVNLLKHESKGVQIWAARYLLPVNETAATAVLEENSEGGGILSFGAKMTLTEWRAGNLKD